MPTKKSAPKENPETKPKIEEDEVIIPPDVLGNNTDISEPSFYEKVTGEDPAKHTFAEDEEEAPQIETVNRKLFFLGGFVFLLTIVVATLIGLFILNSSRNGVEDKKIVTTDEEQIPTPTPTITQIEKGDWTFEILNGSGVKGAASEASEKVEELGFTVDSIGNADENISATEVFIAQGVDKAEAQKVLKELEGAFGKLTIEVEEADTEADILIILGSNEP